ncbi:DUF4062 domain-containing protein [Nannocystis sp. ILAH1]|uniref:DUF4062 domain-containing protein n=1 Tax=Nannocystis sp. ILAH1 TaxID=2996789 RepID=UPI00226D4F42|nr:DUF4062 domain-containing protein [Nannocystis sp. ILAH1]MCY0988107.1 DUF4062 domain-containing protein [Nannocystis sp. ILAH1]
MARPRVFLSSTYYDLRHLRSELEVFIREMGFEPILNERGHIPYGSKQRLEEDCYDEVERGDMLVSIIGGRYGSSSAREQPNSISQLELKTALRSGKQVYIFIEKGVHAEYGTWNANKSPEDGIVNPKIKWRHVDNAKIFEFIEILALPNNNQYAPFEIGRDITTYLKEQWAGLFQRFLRESERSKEVDLAVKLESASSTLNDLVRFLAEQNKSARGGAAEILRFHHPLFARMQQLHQVNYPTMVFTKSHLDARLHAWGFRLVGEDENDKSDQYIYRRSPSNTARSSRTGATVFVAKTLIDAKENLRNLEPAEWTDEMYQFVEDESDDDKFPL